MLKPANLIVIMGVAGCGKSTLGTALATALGCPFIEGDDYHSPTARAKMQAGTPLTDTDRRPWLETLTKAAAESAQTHSRAVVACSALKQSYREHIVQTANQPIAFIYLHCDRQTATDRIKKRSGHFMPTALIESQFAALEPPTKRENALTIAAETPTDAAVQHTVQALAQKP